MRGDRENKQPSGGNADHRGPGEGGKKGEGNPSSSFFRLSGKENGLPDAIEKRKKEGDRRDRFATAVDEVMGGEPGVSAA